MALFFCRGLVYLSVLPPFEGWDEYQHVGYVVHVHETGHPAELGRTNVPRSLLEELVKYPLPRGVVKHQLHRLGVLDYESYWNPSRPLAEPRPGEIALYEAQHSWWYYRLVAPAFAALGGVGNLPSAIGGLRFLNLLCLSAALWLVLGVVGQITKSCNQATWIGLVIASHPLFLINGVRVANDALGILLATAAIVLCFSLSLDDSRWWCRCGAIGLLTGLAILVKAVNYGLIPFVAFAWLDAAVRSRFMPRRTILSGALLLVATLVVIQGEVRSNIRRYGGPTAMQEAIHNRDQGRTKFDLLKTAQSFRWDVRIRRLWLRNSFLVGGWSRLSPGEPLTRVYSWLLAAGLTGAACTLVGRWNMTDLLLESRRTMFYCGVLCLSFTAALAYHMVQSKLAWGEPTTCPWYAGIAFPWFLIAVTAGGFCWPFPQLRIVVPLGLSATCLGAEWFVIGCRMLPTYSGGATGVEALRRIAELQAPLLGPSTIVASEVTVVLLASVLIGIGFSHKSCAS